MTELNSKQQEILSENGLIKSDKVDKRYFDYFRSDSNFDIFNTNYDDCKLLQDYLHKYKLDEYLYISNGFYFFILFDIKSLTLIQLAYVKNDFDLIDSYIAQFKKRMNQPFEPKKILSLTDKAYKIMILKLLIEDNRIAQADKRRLALSAYQHSEYHFNDFDFKQLFIDKKPNADDFRLLCLKVSGKKIKIWRGMSSKSSILEDTLSWTLKKSVALKFANRFISEGKKGILYSAVVNVDDVLAYINSDEEEILVDYYSLISIKKEDI